MRSLARWLVIVVPIALILGIGTELSGCLPYPWNLISVMGVPWVVGAFIGGRLSGRRAWLGAGTGIAMIGLGLVVNGAYNRLAYGPESVRHIFSDVWYWVALAVLLGALLGTAGAISAQDESSIGPIGWGFGLGVVLAEAIAIISGYRGGPARLAWINIAVLASMTFFAGLRSRPWIFVPVAIAVGALLASSLPIARRVLHVV